MPIGDQVGRGDDDVVRRIGALEALYQVILGIAGNAAALAAAIQAGLGALASSGTTWAGPVASPSTVTAASSVSSPQGTFSSGISSAGAYTTDVSALPGARQTVWQHNSGVYGFAPSTRAKKTNIRDYTGKASAFLACRPKVYEYIAQIDIRDNPENAYFDPEYVVPTDMGLLAEDLIAAGLGEFVIYEEDGKVPAGIDYITFSAVGFLVCAEDFDARLKALEAKA